MIRGVDGGTLLREGYEGFFRRFNNLFFLVQVYQATGTLHAYIAPITAEEAWQDRHLAALRQYITTYAFAIADIPVTTFFPEWSSAEYLSALFTPAPGSQMDMWLAAMAGMLALRNARPQIRKNRKRNAAPAL
jgi:hypothetical protein